jgi:hypothetical protein
VWHQNEAQGSIVDVYTCHTNETTQNQEWTWKSFDTILTRYEKRWREEREHEHGKGKTIF